MKENRTKRLLREGKTAVGAWMVTSDPMLTEDVGGLGFDYVVIDTEHTVQTRLTLQGHMMALKDSRATPVVRVAWNDPVLVKQTLDTGAQGIVFPWISTIEHAHAAVRATRYPPRGIRGFGPRRAQRYADSFEDYVRNADDNILVICQIETREGVDNAEAIAQVEGVDALMIGPCDLSINLGVPLDLDCDTTVKALEHVHQAAEAAGKAFGVITSGAEPAKRWLAMGARLVLAGSDIALLTMFAAATLDELRKEIG